MEELKEYIAGLIETFSAQPAQFRERMGSFDLEELHQPLEPGGWSPHQVMAHVLAAESEALLPRILRMLDEHEPDLSNWDETRWMADEYPPGRPVSDLLTEYATVRRSLGDRLTEITLEDWNRAGTHPTRGRRTVLWWLEYTIAHANDHLAQLAA